MVGGLRGQSGCLGHSAFVSKPSPEADRPEGRREANGCSLRFCTDRLSLHSTPFEARILREPDRNWFVCRCHGLKRGIAGIYDFLEVLSIGSFLDEEVDTWRGSMMCPS